jgi:hypothetical protein
MQERFRVKLPVDRALSAFRAPACPSLDGALFRLSHVAAPPSHALSLRPQSWHVRTSSYTSGSASTCSEVQALHVWWHSGRGGVVGSGTASAFAIP